MASSWPPMALDLDEVRAITGWAATCALQVLDIFEHDHPGYPQPREAIVVARRFAAGDRREVTLRVCAWAARDASLHTCDRARAEAALAASAAAASAFLHPVASPSQIHHVLDAAVHHARAIELDAGDDRDVGPACTAWAAECAPPAVSAVLARMPPAPTGRTRRAALLTDLDARLRR